MQWTENVTDDGGRTYKLESEEVIFGAYFFLSDKKIDYQMKRYDIFSYLSQIGGLLNTVTVSVSIFMIIYNGKASAASIIQNMYFNPTVVDHQQYRSSKIKENPP